jgi:transposase
MAFLGEQLEDQTGASVFSPRCNKDLIEEDLFRAHQDLFSSLELVFFDTTSIYFEGRGGESLGKRGYSKDHRPDLNQMIVGAVIDDKGNPICCEMWPGNTADVASLTTVTDGIRSCFGIRKFCVVAIRRMISAKNIEQLEGSGTAYILGTRMRLEKQIRKQVVTCGTRYRQVRPEGLKAKDPSPLKVREVRHRGIRYIVCLNVRQARKEARDRAAIIKALKEKINQGPKAMIGNKGYRKYLKMEKGSVSIDHAKVRSETRFDGKWMLRTNTDLSAEKVALTCEELWQVERVFRDMKSLLEILPIFHRRDDTIRGHVFCSSECVNEDETLKAKVGFFESSQNVFHKAFVYASSEPTSPFPLFSFNIFRARGNA